MEACSRALTESWRQRREEIFERDGGECQFCAVGEPVASLEVHRIDPVEIDGGDENDNLVTLCQRCHQAIHRLGDGTEYPVEILERAGEQNQERETADAKLDDRYRDTTPDGWEREEWERVTSESEAPARATLTVKDINDNRYYYWQWRDGEKIRSESISPVDS